MVALNSCSTPVRIYVSPFPFLPHMFFDGSAHSLVVTAAIGLGVWQNQTSQEHAVTAALKAGYRHIDSAQV